MEVVSLEEIANLTVRLCRRPYGPSPLRRPDSVRRTSSIDTRWPQGMGLPTEVVGRARDIYTPIAGGGPQVLAEDWADITASVMREIQAIDTNRDPVDAANLVGVRAGGHLRAALTAHMPREAEESTPLHLLLDDFAGASLVATWAMSRFDPDWMETRRKQGITTTAGKAGQMEGICSGFRPGSSALLPDGRSNTEIQNYAEVPELVNPADPDGWHALPHQTGMAHRRARRLDLWEEGGLIHIDAGFQDSALTPSGDRHAVHEYELFATATADTFELISVEADPRVLPYRECPGATDNIGRMIGQRLESFRWGVLKTLPGSIGCTHLNDMLRSLSDVPVLAAKLRAARDADTSVAAIPG